MKNRSFFYLTLHSWCLSFANDVLDVWYSLSRLCGIFIWTLSSSLSGVARKIILPSEHCGIYTFSVRQHLQVFLHSWYLKPQWPCIVHLAQHAAEYHVQPGPDDGTTPGQPRRCPGVESAPGSGRIPGSISVNFISWLFIVVFVFC